MADPGYAAPPPGQADYQQPPPPGYGAPHQPGYGQPQHPGYGQPAMVVTTQPQAHHTTIIQQGAPPRPSNYLILAIFVTICCSLPFGIIAIIFSVLSSSAYDSGDVEGARTKGKVSLALSIIGLLSTIVVIVIVIVYYTVVVASVVSSVCGSFC